MSEGLTNQEQQVLIFVLRENIASLEAEMKSRERAYQNTDTGWRNMNIADAARIEELEADLLASQAEANGLRLRVAGLLIEIEDLSNE